MSQFHFRRFWAVLFVGITMFSVSGWSFVIGPCARSFNEDSYGRGIEYGFRGTGGKPYPVNEMCFKLGLDEAAQIKSEDSSSKCRADFSDGFKKGFDGESAIGSKCYSSGATAGLASLRSNARAKSTYLVGESCVTAYSDGFANAPFAGSVFRDRICYDTGFYDKMYISSP